MIFSHLALLLVRLKGTSKMIHSRFLIVQKEETELRSWEGTCGVKIFRLAKVTQILRMELRAPSEFYATTTPTLRPHIHFLPVFHLPRSSLCAPS